MIRSFIGSYKQLQKSLFIGSFAFAGSFHVIFIAMHSLHCCHVNKKKHKELLMPNFTPKAIFYMTYRFQWL